MSGAKACALYDTKRGSTRKIVEWIAEVLRKEGFEVRLFTPRDEVPEDCSFFIVASPVYYERPLKSVLEYVKEHEEFRGKKAFALIICTVPKALEDYAKRMYLAPLVKALEEAGAEVVGAFLLPGWIVRPSEECEAKAKEVVREMVALLREG